MTLEINLLGNFQVTYNGEALDGFSTDKVRALFAYLIVEQERPHHRQQLSTLLWPDQPDNRSRHNLRQALSNLKQALPNDECLEITSKTILFKPNSSIQIDIAKFSALAKCCEQHKHDAMNFCLPCIQRQNKMLALYRGEFLHQFPAISAEPFEEWLVITREAFHQLAMQSQQILMAFHENRGEFDHALKLSKQITQYEPWNEEGYRKTMLYFAWQGKRSDALKEYERCKTELNKEFGVLPTEETQTLALDIVENRLGKHTPPPKTKLPSSSFVGRKQELMDIAELLSNPNCRLLTLQGAGGSGKTRLAQQCAYQHAGIFADGIHFVPLANINNVAEAVQLIGMTLHLELENNPLQQICEHLQEKHFLLILDNFEHIAPDCELISQLFKATAKTKILVTSRERLCLQEEWVYCVEGLSFQSETTQQDEILCDAVNLFIQRAQQTKHDFEINEQNKQDILKICELVEGFPLGIELAASTIADQACKTIAETLKSNLSAINIPFRNLPERHRNLQAAFDHSWKLLPEIEQLALSELSVFAGDFSATAANQVTGTSLEILGNLVKRSLLKLSNEGLYGFHGVIHQFAKEKCERAEPLFIAHAKYFTEFVQQIEDFSSPEGVTILQNHRSNIQAAWNWIVDNQVEISLLPNLLPAILTIYLRLGPLSDGKILFNRSIEKLKKLSKQSELTFQLAIAIGFINLELCEFNELIENSQTIIEQSPFVHQHAQAKYLLGQVYSTKGETEKANSVLLQALSYSEDENDIQLKMNILIELGRVSLRASEYDMSSMYCHQALDLANQQNDLYGKASALSTLATVHFYIGKLQEGRQIYEQVLSLYQQLKDRQNEARTCNNLSNITAEMGDLSLSLEYSHKALSLLSNIGNEQRKGFVLHNLGATYWELGDYYKAENTYQKALNIYKKINIPHAAAEIYANLALTKYALGNLEKAKEYAECSIKINTDVNNKENMANAHHYLGKIEYKAGNIIQAQRAFEQGLAIRKEIPHPGRIAEFSIALAQIAFDQSDNERGWKLCNQLLEMIDKGESFSGADDPISIYYALWQILDQNNNERAEEILTKGFSILQERADLITDPMYRKAYLENIFAHKQVLIEYERLKADI